MNNFFTIQENQAQQFYWFDQVFTHQELKWIEDGVSNIPYTRADVIGEHTEDRKSNIKWIPQSVEWEWLYQKLIQMASEANNQLWNFDLHSAPELIQYTEYEATEFGKYDWHQDIGNSALSIRKISITVQLSDSEEYEGGDLCFWRGGESLDKNSIAAPRGKGNVVLFPSYMVHSVKPVTKGTRKSFVLWLGGGHYK
jgi:PKHD-type hydroxylase|tara:strand:- start:45 stop:635 length:591 start_codon:yes stop_codon:yes gene_type:complete